ncbi:carboxymuconolactone decarboxylase family protein [Fibrella aquatilis]|uniref:carboxymuconolactone decarboxylase family protein n=1 Tax=Fibrella aquatilis TaxID=2817059 RepID=UPI001E46F847|nr:carboxymuconolactone decarboxylase family protein [Fibrella aquatilis]
MPPIAVSTVMAMLALVLNVSRLNAQGNPDQPALSPRQQQIVVISALTAKGDLQRLPAALARGLEAGLTVSEIREVLVHLYAYCGFPRSIRGLQTFMATLDERKKRGVTDVAGNEATATTSGESKYERGKKTLETLTGQPQTGPARGYAAFSPEIDVFLKEHLFADIFGRDVLSYADRELTTIAVLSSLGGVEPMMQSHMGIGLRVGLTAPQLMQALDLIEVNVGKAEATAGRAVLAVVRGGVTAAISPTAPAKPDTLDRGERLPATHFTGAAWVRMLVPADSAFNVPVGQVTFEPGARTYWHTHAGGQVLLATDGVGYYQEKGKPVQVLRKGDAVKCPPNVPHWHGASPQSGFTQVAITPNTATGRTTWLQQVTEAEYNNLKE